MTEEYVYVAGKDPYKLGEDLQPGDRIKLADGRAATIRSLPDGAGIAAELDRRAGRYGHMAPAEWYGILSFVRYEMVDSPMQ